MGWSDFSVLTYLLRLLNESHASCRENVNLINQVIRLQRSSDDWLSPPWRVCELVMCRTGDVDAWWLWHTTVDLTADWSLLGSTQFSAMRRLHSWTSAVCTLAGALVIAGLIIAVIYCKIHRLHHRTVCRRRTTSYDSQLEYAYATSVCRLGRIWPTLKPTHTWNFDFFKNIQDGGRTLFKMEKNRCFSAIVRAIAVWHVPRSRNGRLWTLSTALEMSSFSKILN